MPCAVVVRPTDAVNRPSGTRAIPEGDRMSKRSAGAPAYSTRLSVPVTEALNAAVANAASQSLTSINSFVRIALLEKLTRDGVEIVEN
jgi:hypothetical protein